MLQRALGVSELRELEDLVIDAIYKGLLQGKLDQQRQRVEVELAMGRDLHPDSLDYVADVLSTWQQQSGELLRELHEAHERADRELDAELRRRDKFARANERQRADIGKALELQGEMAVDGDPNLARVAGKSRARPAAAASSGSKGRRA